jgi:hypothetical protein
LKAVVTFKTKNGMTGSPLPISVVSDKSSGFFGTGGQRAFDYIEYQVKCFELHLSRWTTQI